MYALAVASRQTLLSSGGKGCGAAIQIRVSAGPAAFGARFGCVGGPSWCLGAGNRALGLGVGRF